MPMYEWKCRKCEASVEVFNKMADSGVPPEKPCECGSEDWEKQLSAGSFRWRYVDESPTKKG